MRITNPHRINSLILILTDFIPSASIPYPHFVMLLRTQVLVWYRSVEIRHFPQRYPMLRQACRICSCLIAPVCIEIQTFSHKKIQNVEILQARKTTCRICLVELALLTKAMTAVRLVCGCLRNKIMSLRALCRLCGYLGESNVQLLFTTNGIPHPCCWLSGGTSSPHPALLVLLHGSWPVSVWNPTMVYPLLSANVRKVRTYITWGFFT